MIVLATKFSHKIGYGHFFRCLNIIDNFGKKNCLLLINQKNRIQKYLNKINFKVVNYKKKNWEDEIIKKFKIKIWINDRLNTSPDHVNKLKKSSIFSVGLDETGAAKDKYNLNISQNINIRKYRVRNFINNRKLLVLKKVNKKNIFLRKKLKKIMITFGGSDTYFMTNKILGKLNKSKYNISAYYGPGYKNKISSKMNKNINHIQNINNLENEMIKYDLLICGGGITPINAASQGLPSLIVACEKHEIYTAKYLKRSGTSQYLGFRKLPKKNFNLTKINLKKMSKNCLKSFDNNGAANFVNFIIKKYNDQRKK